MTGADGVPAAIETLQQALEKTAREYDATSDAGEARKAVIGALRAVTDFAQIVGCQIWPLLQLQDALLQLGRGVTAPILIKTNAKGGRGRTGISRGGLQGFALGVVRSLVDYGDKLPEARHKVAAVLCRAGVRPLRGAGKITERTIKEWGDAASAAPKSPAASLLSRFPPSARSENPDAEKALFLKDLTVTARRFVEKSVNPPS